MKITWLGHSSFRIEIEQAVLLIDPWLEGNPMFPADARAAALEGATHILLTHGHSDHASNAKALSTELGLPLVGNYDLIRAIGDVEGVAHLGFNKGGTVDLGGAKVTMVNAVHSSTYNGQTAGSEAGFMIAGEGQVIYLSGDTDIMADMAWMGEYHRPDIAIWSCGGFYTMDMARAAWAAKKYFNFKTFIPCHYRTFGALEQSAASLIAALPEVNVIEPQVMTSITL